MLNDLLASLPLLLSAEVVFFMFVGVIIGIILGAIPGLGPAMGIGVLLPFTFVMDTVVSIVFLVAIYKGGFLGGSISAILLNTPGVPAAAATAMDGYPLSKRGHSRKALQAAIFSSALGDLGSDIFLLFFISVLARIALRFGPIEMFWVITFSLVMTSSLAGDSIWKGILSMGLGLLLGAVGLDPITSVSRFGIVSMIGRIEGLPLLAVLLGAFAVSEVFMNIGVKKSTTTSIKDIHGPSLNLEDVKDSFKGYMVGQVTGTAVGVVPGMGATAGAFLSYGIAKSLYNGKAKSGKFGEGAIPGVVAAETGNNAVSGANLLPLFTLGIPGSSVAALFLAALQLQGISPGPTIMINYGTIVYAIILAFILANFANLLCGNLLLKPLTKILKSNPSIVFPIILLLCFTGVYATNYRILDLWIMVVIGILSYFLRKGKVPLSPMVISFVLARSAEESLRLGLGLSRGNYSILYASSISKVLIGLCVIGLILVIVQRLKSGGGKEDDAAVSKANNA